MKAFFGIILAALFLFTTTQELAFIVLYQLNKKSITENYCVNKNNKASKCNGRCYLNKVISASESNNNKNPFSNSNYKSKGIEIIYQKIAKITTLPSAEVSKSASNYIYTPILLKGISCSLIKPPIV